VVGGLDGKFQEARDQEAGQAGRAGAGQMQAADIVPYVASALNRPIRFGILI
jgi:hypothetical protein